MKPIDMPQRPTHPVHQLLALLDRLGEMVLATDRRARLIYLSGAARKLLDVEGDVSGAHLGGWAAALADIADERIESALDEYALTPGHGRQDATLMLKRGDGSSLEAGVAVCKTELQGEPVYVWLLRDYSRLRRAEMQMLDAQRLVRSILRNTSEGYVLVDAGGMVIDSNPAFEALCGIGAMDLRESRLDSLFDGRGQRAVQGLVERLAKGRAASAELVFRRGDGSEAIGYFKGAPLFDASDEQVGLFGLVTDVTEAKAREHRIEKLAYYDPLTDLANRTLLHEKLEQAVLLSQRTGRKFALLFLDLDKFKHVNDTFNHPLGDRLLRQVAQRIRGVVRRSDVVARFGGDEFVIGLIEPRRIEDAALVAEKLLETIAQPFEIEEHTLHITTSVGISVFPDDAVAVDDLVRNADLAMYQAKDEGRERYCYFTEALNERVRYQRDMERQMRRAVELDEFVLYYQPKVDGVSGRIVGAEALIRWQNPTLGMVSPSDFIPLAEESGMIVPIGAWVLQRAARQIVEWSAEFGRVPVAVNISGVQLHHAGFLEQLEALTSQSDAVAQCLELEITESSLMRDVEHTIGLLRKLCGLGFILSIDDFGTGYSSFNYLTRFPIHTLKIDQSFVRDLPHNTNAATIVGAITGMAKSLGLNIVAEGVEKREQAQYLASLGCDQLQGYFFSKPVPAEQFARMLRAGSITP